MEIMQSKSGATTLNVGLAERSYKIDVNYACLTQLGDALHELKFPQRVVVVSNTVVAPLYLDLVVNGLNSSGFTTDTIVVADGEKFKNTETLNEIYTQLIKLGYDRSCALVALGGGVIGDMAGFAAATFMRGIPFVQVPTTLLSQVDSSVGGKTAVNHPLGKNMIGAFYQPRYVMIDIKTLATLPVREFVAGLAEVIKYGMIYDGDFFAWLENNVTALMARDRTAIKYAITTSCQIKAQVVEQDETEGSVRAILNFGHTFGHAVEQLSGYGNVLHGEAVAIGMVVAAKFSHQLDLCSASEVERLIALLKQCGLPVTAPQFSAQQYVAAMCRDKKVKDGVLRVVLNRGIGRYALHSLSDPQAIIAAVDVEK
jgi:3-dehydroquinate synthase